MTWTCKEGRRCAHTDVGPYVMEVSPRFQICHRETQTNHCGCKDVKALPALLETHPSSGALDAVKSVYLLDDVTSVSILKQHCLQIK